MNKVHICGKIVKIINFGKVTYLTIHVRDGKHTEWIDVTSFDTRFIDRYLCEGMWIGVNGRLHKNAQKDYRIELIAEEFIFIGDVPIEVNSTKTEEYEELTQAEMQSIQEIFP